MEIKKNLPEKFLYEIWKNQSFEGKLNNEEHEHIEVLNTGTENNVPDGPDFLNSKIKIGNFIYSGDIEIDIHYNDWKSHGHNYNKKYNNVILHVYLNSGHRLPYVISQSGKKIPSISIYRLLKDSVRSMIQEAIVSERQNRLIKMACIETNRNVAEQSKLDFIFDLGIDRFKHKCSKIMERLKELAYLKQNNIKEPVINYHLDSNFHNTQFQTSDFNDPHIWFELIYENIFEALGYSKNKDIMLKLAKAIDNDFYKVLLSKDDSIKYIEAALFNISGLFDSNKEYKDPETLEYLKDISSKWSEVKHLYTGQKFDATQWKYAGLRPSNFPTVRLAGAARYIVKLYKENLMGNIIAEMNVNNDSRKIIREIRDMLIIQSNGYWVNHYVIGEKTDSPIRQLVGISRVDEILVNVILPILAVYFDLFNKKNLLRKVYKIYTTYTQGNDNNLVGEISDTLELRDAWKRSVIYQGIIELFRNYCTCDKCLECQIGKLAFEPDKEIELII